MYNRRFWQLRLHPFLGEHEQAGISSDEQMLRSRGALYTFLVINLYFGNVSSTFHASGISKSIMSLGGSKISRSGYNENSDVICEHFSDSIVNISVVRREGQ
jgi:hypothetical protein